MSTQNSKDPIAAKNANIEAELAEEEAKVNAELAKGDGTPADDSAPKDTTPASDKGGGEEGQPAKPAEKPAEPVKPVVDEEDKGEEGEVDLSQLSEKAQERFKKLADENKRLREEKAQRPAGGQPTAPVTPGIPEILNGKAGDGKLPWDTTPSGDGGTREITQEEYDAQVEARARKAAREEINNERILTTLHDDTVALEEKYPQLRENNEDGTPNPDFDASLVKDVADWYKKLFKEDHTLRLSQFVDKLMSLRSKGAEQGKAQATETLAKQAASQAVSPSGTPSSKSSEADLESQIRGAKTQKELDELEKRLPHA